MRTSLTNILNTLPMPETTNYRGLNRELFRALGKTCIIIDDDPTGNQTVYGVPLLTQTSLNVFVREFENGTPVFFVLTNSRSLSVEETTKLYTELAQNISKASQITKRQFCVVSRSDSTLRGHFPLEPSILSDVLGLKQAITSFIPVMFEGNRITVNDTHYINDGGELIPVNETPFAKDHFFGYTKANLKQYIEEKSNGKIKARSVYSFSLECIRNNSVEVLSEAIFNLPDSSYCIFNSVDYSDLDKVTNALLLAEKGGKQILYRTSSSFVPSYIGLKPRPLLDINEILTQVTPYGGLTVVGSYVKKSSDQLKEALKLFDATTTLQVDVEQVLGSDSEKYLRDLMFEINSNLKAGYDTIVFTSRKHVTGINATANINIASVISNALVHIVKCLTVKPKYLIAKGGITSHDLATKGLGMQRSEVIGQIQAGIPVWKMDEQTKFPNLPYIVFPGNVGTITTLKDVITKLNNE